MPVTHGVAGSSPVQTAQNVEALKRKASMAGGLENPRMFINLRVFVLMNVLTNLKSFKIG